MTTIETKTLTVGTIIYAPVEKVWNLWTDPSHIIHWNNASDDWHTPKAENDLRAGGRFLSRMEAKDGSQGFDFTGEYTKIKQYEHIEYILSDGRKVEISFVSKNNETMITETFEAEQLYTAEMQEAGWQSILNNFKKYVESYDIKRDTRVQKIIPFLWFDQQAETAVNFYTSIFKDSGITLLTHYGADGPEVSGMQKGMIMTMAFQIEGQDFIAINGGPIFEINHSISFFVNCDTPQEVDRLWEKLSDGGTVLMELNKYPFSEKYGWVQDKFGVSWQLILSGRMQKIAPCFMFAGKQHRRAEEAISFYISVFKNSEIIQLERYEADQVQKGAIVHARFILGRQEFIAMDSHTPLPCNFNPAISLVVNCETQEEIDYYWEKLSEHGDESMQQCGWLQDKYGISWQIVPVLLGKLLSDPDAEKSERVMHTMLQMKKIEIKTLLQAYDHQ